MQKSNLLRLTEKTMHETKKELCFSIFSYKHDYLLEFQILIILWDIKQTYTKNCNQTWLRYNYDFW